MRCKPTKNRRKPNPDVLLETVATSSYEGSSPCAPRRKSGYGNQTRDQSEELLAFFPDTRHALRNTQQVAGATGTSFAQTTLV